MQAQAASAHPVARSYLNAELGLETLVDAIKGWFIMPALLIKTSVRGSYHYRLVGHRRLRNGDKKVDS
jgi:hypothetical protein